MSPAQVSQTLPAAPGKSFKQTSQPTAELLKVDTSQHGFQARWAAEKITDRSESLLPGKRFEKQCLPAADRSKFPTTVTSQLKIGCDRFRDSAQLLLNLKLLQIRW